MRRTETGEGKNQFVSFCFARRWRSVAKEIFRLEMSIVINRQFMAANAAAPASSSASPPLCRFLPRRRHLPTNWRRARLQTIIRNLWPVHTDRATQSVSPEAAPKTSLLKSPHQNANWFKISTLNYIIYANLFYYCPYYSKTYLSLRFALFVFVPPTTKTGSITVSLSGYRYFGDDYNLWFFDSVVLYLTCERFMLSTGHGKHTSGPG